MPPLQPFGKTSITSFLVPGLPATPPATMTDNMRNDLDSWETLIKKAIKNGEVKAGTTVVCEMDRAANKAWKLNIYDDMTPTLRCSNSYLFAFSTEDIDNARPARRLARR
eukprot:12895383-Alexandrium_andersonii.AAC.1